MLVAVVVCVLVNVDDTVVLGVEVPVKLGVVVPVDDAVVVGVESRHPSNEPSAADRTARPNMSAVRSQLSASSRKAPIVHLTRELMVPREYRSTTSSIDSSTSWQSLPAINGRAPPCSSPHLNRPAVSQDSMRPFSSLT